LGGKPPRPIPFPGRGGGGGNTRLKKKGGEPPAFSRVNLVFPPAPPPSLLFDHNFFFSGGSFFYRGRGETGFFLGVRFLLPKNPGEREVIAAEKNRGGGGGVFFTPMVLQTKTPWTREPQGRGPAPPNFRGGGPGELGGTDFSKKGSGGGARRFPERGGPPPGGAGFGPHFQFFFFTGFLFK